MYILEHVYKYRKLHALDGIKLKKNKAQKVVPPQSVCAESLPPHHRHNNVG